VQPLVQAAQAGDPVAALVVAQQEAPINKKRCVNPECAFLNEMRARKCGKCWRDLPNAQASRDAASAAATKALTELNPNEVAARSKRKQPVKLIASNSKGVHAVACLFHLPHIGLLKISLVPSSPKSTVTNTPDPSPQHPAQSIAPLTPRLPTTDALRSPQVPASAPRTPIVVQSTNSAKKRARLSTSPHMQTPDLHQLLDHSNTFRLYAGNLSLAYARLEPMAIDPSRHEDQKLMLDAAVKMFCVNGRKWFWTMMDGSPFSFCMELALSRPIRLRVAPLHEEINMIR
jgi:hypothetical protein